MGIIEKHMGCPGPGKVGGCYGPVGPYYTVFGTELRFLTGPMIISVLIGLLIFALLFILNKKEKINFPLYLVILIPIISASLLFFIFAYFFPVRVMY